MNVQNERQEAGPIDLVAGETACIDATDGLNAIPAVLDTPSLEATKSPAPEEALPEKVVTDEVVSEPFSVSTKIETSESTDPRVVELRALLPAELSALLTDGDCSRFLRARSYNITKAVDMLLKWGKWWETPLPGMDVLPKDICSKPDEQEDVYTRMLPHANLGENINGCPIYWEKTGQISSRFQDIKKELSEDDIFNRHIRQQEVMIRRLQRASERHGRPIEKQIIVMDMKNVSMTMDFMALRVFKRTVVIDEACYPERLETLYMINAPFTFSVLWAIIKPWIDPVTVAKFKILGSNYKEALKETIAVDQIPVEYGGTCENFCWSFPENIAQYDRLY